MALPDFLLWLLLALAAFRLTRIVTADTISLPYRNRLRALMPPGKEWYESVVGYMVTLIECPWCWGTYVTAAVYAWAWYLWDIPHPVVQAFAGMALVGAVGSRFED